MEKTIQQKLDGYDKVIENITKWWPATGKPESKEAIAQIENWRKRTLAKIKRSKAKLMLAVGHKEVQMEKVVQLKFVDQKTMQVSLKRDLKVGNAVGATPSTVLKNLQTIKKGTKVTVQMLPLTYGGLLLRVVIPKVGTKYALLNGRNQSVEAILKHFFQPEVKSYHVCSIIPKSVRDELMGFRIRIYSEKPSIERFKGQVNALNQSLIHGGKKQELKAA